MGGTVTGPRCAAPQTPRRSASTTTTMIRMTTRVPRPMYMALSYQAHRVGTRRVPVDPVSKPWRSVGLGLLALLLTKGRARRTERRREEAGTHYEEARARQLEADRRSAEAQERSARAKREAAAAEQQALEAERHRSEAAEHEDRARELDPDVSSSGS